MLIRIKQDRIHKCLNHNDNGVGVILLYSQFPEHLLRMS